MEEYIGFAIMLFLLSMICERFADFLKHFIGEQNTLLAVWLKKYLYIGNTIDKGLPDSAYEDKRYYRILKINIICGILTAIFLHADLFTILNNLKHPENAITWSHFYIEWYIIFPVRVIDTTGTGTQSFPLFLLGCVLTGLFISFGSKFWHDMLDLLLEIKNLRRKMNDKRTYEIPDTIENFDAFIRSPESKLAASASEEHEEALRRIPGVVSVGPGYMDSPEGRMGCLEVHFNDEKAMQAVPAMVQVTVGTMRIPVPVNKFLTGDAEIYDDIFGAGILTGNSNGVNGWGALGCIVRKKGNPTDRYILSCHHVLSSLKNFSGEENNRNILIKQKKGNDSSTDTVAVFEDGMRTDNMDAAIARITDNPERFNNLFIGLPRIIRKVSSADAKSKIKVSFFSRMRDAEFSGIVVNDSWKETLTYSDRPFEITDLIVMTNMVGNNTRGFGVKGDSGALVRDANNSAIGIVVGGDKCFTYAVKMTAIEKQFDIELL